MIKDILRKLKKRIVRERIIPISIPIYEGCLLQNKLAFISGGSGGIGFSIAERFIANGCQVIISGTNEERLKTACNKLGNGSRYVVMDVCQPEKIEGTLNSFITNEKIESIDIMVNCAGVHGPSHFLETTVSDWDAVFSVNLRGMFFLAQYYAKYCIRNSIKGHILNVSSASALKPGKTPYEISKAGVASLTRGMATELIRYGIVVNCIAPGPTATKMLNKDSTQLNWEGNPSGRVATPDEIANWAVFLASGMGDYVVGDSVYVTGGSGTICIDR